jgi:UDP-3-O-[3-hydroxymyristoyl] glucosamine N-acyltransferase
VATALGQPVAFTLQELATMCGGKLTGDPTVVIKGAASLLEAAAGEITFFADSRYLSLLRKTQASAVFVPEDFSESISPARIRVASPAKAFAQVAAKLAPAPIKFAPGIHSTALVDATAKLGHGVSVQPHAIIEADCSIGDETVIGAGCYIGPGCSIGAQTLLYPNAVIRERCVIGDRVIIHSGAVIGADGFGFEMVEGRFTKVPQTGIVQIDEDVEIGANTTIDRARFGRTWIQRGVKIDNLVQIAHNVVVGEHSAIAAQVGIAGSVRIGKYVLIAGQAGLVGHVEVSDRAMIGAQSGVSKSIGPGPWLLSPAVPLEKAKDHIAWVHRLGKLLARVKAIEEKLGL